MIIVIMRMVLLGIMLVILISIQSIQGYAEEGKEVGSIKGEVKNPWVRRYPAVIYIDKIEGMTFQPPINHSLMDQFNLAFVPFVLPILVGTTVDFANRDAVNHSIFTPSEIGDKFDLGRWASKDETRGHKFTKQGVAVILCNIHSEMEGWILVAGTPFFATTDSEGSFFIKDVPKGRHRLKLWHKKLPLQEKEIIIKPGDVVNVEFSKR